MDADKDGEISFVEFFSAVQADPIMMNALGMSTCGLSIDSKSPGLLPSASNGQPSSPGGEGAAFRLSTPCLPGEDGEHKQSDDQSGKCCNCCALM